MATEITKQNTSVTLPPPGYWGNEKVDAVDLIIPRIVLAQGNSDLINSGIASPGDLVDSVNTTVLAKRGSFIEIIPFKMDKLYRRSVKNPQNGKWEKLVTEKYDTRHLSLEWNEKGQDGKEYKNEAILMCSCVLATNTTGFPYLISFRGTSYFAGKKMVNHFKECEQNKTPPASWAFKLSSKQQSGQGNSWWALDVAKSRVAKEPELLAAYKWYTEFKTKTVEMETEEETVPF